MLKLWHTADAAADHIRSLLATRADDKEGHDFIIAELLGLSDQLGHALDPALRARAEEVVVELEVRERDDPAAVSLTRTPELEVRSDRDTFGCDGNCEHFEKACLTAILVDIAERHGELHVLGYAAFAQEEIEEVADELRRRFKRSLRESRSVIEGLPAQIPIFAAVQNLLKTL